MIELLIDIVAKGLVIEEGDKAIEDYST